MSDRASGWAGDRAIKKSPERGSSAVQSAGAL